MFLTDNGIAMQGRLITPIASRRARSRAIASLFYFGMMAAAFPCYAQNAGLIEINGHKDALQVRLQDASVASVLSELGRRFDLSYGRTAELNRQLTGHYSGTLNQVLARILDGNDYILESSAETVRIVFLGTSAPNGRPGAGPSAPQPQGNPAAPPPSDPSPTVGVNPSAVEVPPLSKFLSGQGQTSPAAR